MNPLDGAPGKRGCRTWAVADEPRLRNRQSAALLHDVPKILTLATDDMGNAFWVKGRQEGCKSETLIPSARIRKRRRPKNCKMTLRRWCAGHPRQAPLPTKTVPEYAHVGLTSPDKRRRRIAQKHSNLAWRTALGDHHIKLKIPKSWVEALCKPLPCNQRR